MATPGPVPSEDKQPALCHHGYTCSFKQAETDHYECSSCGKVARSLSLTSCCGEPYCALYLEKVKESHHGCPNCKAKEFNITPNSRSRNKIQELVVACEMRQEGCGWEGKLKDYDQHQQTCEHVTITCPKDCGSEVKRRELAHHLESDCPEREYQCPHCNFKDTYRHVTDAHMPDCSYYPVHCPNDCGAAGERDDMESHLQDECQLHYVPCKFSHAGCTAKFRREEEREHMDRHIPQHLESLGSYTLLAIAETNKSLVEQNKHLEAKMQQINEETEQIKAESARFKARTEKEVAELNKKLVESEKRVDSLESSVTNITNQDDISPPEPQGEGERVGVREYQALEMKLREKDAKITQLETKLDEQKTRYDKLFTQLTQRMTKLEKDLNDPSRNRRDPPVVEPEMHAENTTLPTFILQNFASLKEKKDRWISSEFDVFQNGPRLMLVVWPSGQGEGRDSHVSVWLEKKVTDEMDFAPTQVTLTLELLCNEHVTNPNQVSVTFPIYPAYFQGFSNTPYEEVSNVFVPHPELAQYLSGDSLEFRVTKMHLRQMQPLY